MAPQLHQGINKTSREVAWVVAQHPSQILPPFSRLHIFQLKLMEGDIFSGFHFSYIAMGHFKIQTNVQWVIMKDVPNLTGANPTTKIELVHTRSI